MADYPFKRADESGFLDNDPFAELMRMAGDDRPKAPEATFSANESFDIDLERELLGDFEPDNDAGPDQGQSRMADHWARDPEPEPAVDFAAAEPEPIDVQAYEPAESIAEEPADFESSLDDLDLSLDLELADDGPHLPLSMPTSSDESTFSYSEAPDETVLDARVHALFADAPIIEPEAEDADAFEMEFDDAFAISEPAAETGLHQPEPFAEPELSVSEEAEDLEIDLEFGDFSEDAQLAAVREADALAPAAVDSIIAPRWEPEDESAYAADLEWQPGSDTVVAPALSFEDDQHVAGRQWSAADLRAEGPVEPMAGHVPFEAETSYEEERAQALEPEPAVSSFEFPTHSDEPESHGDAADNDDLLGDVESWLNADAATPDEQAFAEPIAPVFETAPEPVAAVPVLAPVALSLEDELNALLDDDPIEPMPAVHATYGHAADVAFADAAGPVEPADAMLALDELDLTLDLDFNEPETVDHDAVASHDFIAEDEFDTIADPAQWRDADDDIEQPSAAYDDAPEEAVASSGLVEEPVTARRSGPFAMLAALAPAISRFGGGDRAAAKTAEPAVAAAPLFGMARANRPVAPEIETVDVDDLPVALADDLDIPELHEPDEVAPLFSPDDLEAELDVAFGSLAPEEEPAAGSAAPSAAQPEAVPLQGTFAGGDYAYTAAEYTAPPADDDFGDVAFDYDPDADELDEPLPPKDGLRRKYFILGGVAAVALVAGLGYFAFGVPAGNGVPAIVRADSDPVRVRPENRGGATVPNQDSSAYRRSTGATGVPGAGQEQLVTTAEEPVDVRAAVAPAPQVSDDFPMVGMEEIPMLDEEAAQMLASVKDDDRLLSGAEEGAEDGLISIAPRRVRTLVVRPDGTLVSRDEIPAPATLAEQIAATNVAAAQGEGTAVPLVQDAQPIGSLVPQAGQIPPQTGEVLADDPVMPAEVGVVPSRPQARPEAATPAPVQVASTAPAAAATAAPVQAATAPVGEWSMQIASQPTAEGAQTAYQDLARRYGNVLEGKGVNIVRAEIEGMGTFYRVRIPATTRDDAVQLCTEFKSAGGSCFVSR